MNLNLEQNHNQVKAMVVIVGTVLMLVGWLGGVGGSKVWAQTCAQTATCCAGTSNGDCMCQGSSVSCESNNVCRDECGYDDGVPGGCGSCECGAATCTRIVDGSCAYINYLCVANCPEGNILEGCTGGGDDTTPSPSPNPSLPPGEGGGCGADCSLGQACNPALACFAGVCWNDVYCGGGFEGGGGGPVACVENECGDGKCQGGNK